MEHPHNWDGMMNGATGDDELDNILNGILDFPMESLEAEGLAGDWDSSKSHYLGPIPTDDVLMGPPVAARAKSEVQQPVFVPFPFPPMDAPKPKATVYRFSDSSGSSCINPLLNKCNIVSELVLFQSQSPVSVLESSTSSSVGKASLAQSRVTKRMRSRQARPSGVNPWLASLPFISSGKTHSACKTKGVKKRLSQPLITMEATGRPIEFENSGVIKKCAHCEVTKTPQWREGPMGPKTLCNACGVRYRSGRLFPEYRPAASPTYVPAVHSNSHKKVLEMRHNRKVPVIEIIKGVGN